jgi:hypothetical protein
MKSRAERAVAAYTPPTPLPCVACGQPCTAGQRDEQGRPMHLECQVSAAAAAREGDKR